MLLPGTYHIRLFQSRPPVKWALKWTIQSMDCPYREELKGDWIILVRSIMRLNVKTDCERFENF